MCGGKGTRLKKTLGSDIEKPLVKLKDKPLIEYVITALIQSNRFERIFAAVSSNTKKTSEFIKLNYKDNVTLLETSGIEYSEDYLKIVRYFKEAKNGERHGVKKILFLPIDIPLISVEILAQLITLSQVKPCLTIVLEKGFVKGIGVLPSSYDFIIDNKDYCYSGISVLDIGKIDMDINNTAERIDLFEEEYKILNCAEIACNTNTLEDLEIAEKYLGNL